MKKKIIDATDLRVGDIISISSGEEDGEEDVEKVLIVKKRSGYSPADDEIIRLLTDKGWMEIGRDSQVPVLRRVDEDE